MDKAATYQGYYTTGRFVFGLAMLISFHMVGVLAAAPRLNYIVSVYCFIAFVRTVLSDKPVIHADYILDIVFVSAMVYVSFGLYSYMTLFYLFPLFFAALSIRDKKVFYYPILTMLLYGSVYVIRDQLFVRESMLNIALHGLSFFLITYAANNLNERMTRQEAYIKSLEDERIRMLGFERLYRVSADLAHEIRNPLASISAAAQFIKEGKNAAEFAEVLSSETSRLTNLVNEFLMFSRPASAPAEEVDLSEMVSSIVMRLESDVRLETDIERGIYVKANRVYLDSAIVNIVKNAIEAARSTALVTVRRVNAKGAVIPEVLIEVGDDGAGIDPSINDRMFEPFVTTKPKGTGLGLALAYRVVTSLGGSIRAETSWLGGAKMVISLKEQLRN